MVRLVDVSIAVLARDPNYINNAQAVRDLLPQWPQVMGPEHPLEAGLMGDELAWFVYIYAVLKYAIDNLPNPTSGASLRLSRQRIIGWAIQPETAAQAQLIAAASSTTSFPEASAGNDSATKTHTTKRKATRKKSAAKKAAAAKKTPKKSRKGRNTKARRRGRE